MGFQLWGDEIAYDHQVIGVLTIKPTTLRERAEELLLCADPSAVSEKDHAAEIKDLEDAHKVEIEALEKKVADLEGEVFNLETLLEQLEDGATSRQYLAERDIAQAAARDWRKAYEDLKRATDAGKTRASRKKAAADKRVVAEMLS